MLENLMNPAFAILISMQFVLILLHDLVDIPGLVSGSTIQSAIGKRKVIGIAFMNAIFPGVAAGLAIRFWKGRAPAAVWNYWVIYCSVTVLSAIVMWYVPYLRGRDAGPSGSAARLHGNTVRVLPPRGDNAGPDLFHMLMHLVFLANLCLALLLPH